MSYSVKISYPKEESALQNKTTERRVQEFLEELDLNQVIEEYGKCLTKGYSVSPTFTPPDEESSGEEADPFAIALKLDLAAIPYKASLKIKASGSYEAISQIAKMIESQGFDFDISVKLKINENSPVNFDKTATWLDDKYAKYTVLPKANVSDIKELKSLYDLLMEARQDVKINLKPKVKKDDDDEFATQLAAYPDGTLITLRLTDADIYGEDE